MANTIQSAQIRLDTVIAVGAALTERLFKGDVIQWNHTATGVVGDQAILQSLDGPIIFHGRANTTNYTTRIVLNRDWLKGFYLPTLSANSVLTITRASGRVS